MKGKFLSLSPEQTLAWGKNLGSKLPKDTVIAFSGDLGAGKTTLIKGIAEGASGVDPHEVCSPTFSYLNIYEPKNNKLPMKLPMYHFDLYRLSHSTDFLEMGFEEYFKGGICCIEWSERISDILPKGTLFCQMEVLSPNERKINLHD